MPISNQKKSKKVSYVQSDGAVEVVNASWHYPCTQVSVSTDSTAGLLGVKVKYHPEGDFEVVYAEDGVTPLTIDLTNVKSFQLQDKWVYSLEFTPVGVDNSYTPLLATGVMYQTRK